MSDLKLTYPPSHKLSCSEKPCACGFVPQKNPTEFYQDKILLGTVHGEPWYKESTRCKTCKKWALLVSDDYKLT